MEKIILITGSTDGIGKAAALISAQKGATVIIHGRNKEKVLRTVEDIKKESKNRKISYIIADFTDLEEVKTKFSEYPFNHLDILINNACTFQPRFKKTKDGYEYTFQTCHLAHFVLTKQLLPFLQKSEQGRIINVSSMVHSHNLDLSFLENKRYNGYTAYEVSKLANILFTYELADKLKNTNITVNCLHPGVISTKLLHAGWGIGGASVTVGAENLLYLAFSNELRNISGKYFSNKIPVPSAPITYNKDVRKKFWEETEKMTNCKY